MAKLYRSLNNAKPPYFLDMDEEELLVIQFALMHLSKGAAEAAGYDPDMVEELLLDVTEDYLNEDREESRTA